METIPFLVSLPEEDEQEVKGIFSTSDKDSIIVVRDLPVEKLRENLNKVCQGVATMLKDVKQVGGFELKQVTIQVEVSAEGAWSLLGRLS